MAAAVHSEHPPEAEVASAMPATVAEGMAPPAKKRGVLGKLKHMFGSRKRSRSNHDVPAVQLTGLQLNPQADKSASNQMSKSAESVFLQSTDAPRASISSMKGVSASLEALSTDVLLQRELERKLNRRSFDDDGLPGSPVGTPTTADILSQPHFVSAQGWPRNDRDSNSSLVSVGSSDNDDDFFKRSWKTASGLRQNSTSSDSESDDALDFDAVTKTDKLNNKAARDKLQVRPKRNTVRRGVGVATTMPSLEEKNVLEIAHTFGDERPASSSAPPKRPPDSKAKPSVGEVPILVPRAKPLPTLPDRATNPPPDAQSVSALKEPVASVRISVPHSSPRSSRPETKPRSGSTEEPHSELTFAFSKLKATSAPVESSAAATADVKMKPGISVAAAENIESSKDTVVLPSVTFKENCSTPPARRRDVQPAAAPRPKSMFIPQERSKTLEIKSSTVDEALKGLNYSKSFHGDSPRGTSAVVEKSNLSDEQSPSHDWVQLAKKKTTVAAVEMAKEDVKTTSELVPAKPVPAPRAVTRPNITVKFDQAPVKATSQLDAVTTDSVTTHTVSNPVPIDTASRPVLLKMNMGHSFEETSARPKEGATLIFRSHTPDKETFTEKVDSHSSTKQLQNELPLKESYIIPKTAPTVVEDKETPWKSRVKAGQGSLKSPALPASAPSWKSSSVREKGAGSTEEAPSGHPPTAASEKLALTIIPLAAVTSAQAPVKQAASAVSKALPSSNLSQLKPATSAVPAVKQSASVSQPWHEQIRRLGVQNASVTSSSQNTQVVDKPAQYSNASAQVSNQPPEVSGKHVLGSTNPVSGPGQNATGPNQNTTGPNQNVTGPNQNTTGPNQTAPTFNKLPLHTQAANPTSQSVPVALRPTPVLAKQTAIPVTHQRHDSGQDAPARSSTNSPSDETEDSVVAAKIKSTTTEIFTKKPAAKSATEEQPQSVKAILKRFQTPDQ